MNGIEKITDRIAADVQLEITAINDETSVRCAEITENYKDIAKAERDRIVSDGKSAAQLQYERLCSAAQLDAKKHVLREKQVLIAEAFDKAISVMRSLPDDKYAALLARLAVQAAQTGSEEIAFSPDDREKFGDTVCNLANRLLSSNGKNAALTVSGSTRDIIGGVVLINGKIESDCSFEGLINERKNELTGEVAKILFD